MRIIDRVDINYFRSAYSVSLTGCNHTNVLTGSNDSGKSNILKALNLFFNDEVEPHSDLEFIRDLNRDRELEARAAKGRMTIWMKIHFNNFLEWDSLPDKFFVKKAWNRYDMGPVVSYSDNVPSSTMGRFLNKIRYHYIPAVRSRDIFADLLADLHDTLVLDETRGLKNSSDALVEDLSMLTKSMSEEILKKLKIESAISVPESLQQLFRALDFSTKFGRHEVPLLLRGDGIQSRHLPFILDYISSKSTQHHIWGYEEPENSLELSKSFEMADDFKEMFSTKNQIFLTTHSPAFYDISGERSEKWYVENSKIGDRQSTTVIPLDTVASVDKTMGLLDVITPRMKEVYEQYSSLKETITEMQTRLESATCPIVYVEGPTDAIILNKARDLLGFGDSTFKFEPAGGAGDITQFLKVSIRVKVGNIPLFGLFDADARGRKELKNFQSSHKFPGTELRQLDKNKKIFVGSLLTPDHLIEAESNFRLHSVSVPIPIEFMFDKAVIDSAIEAGVIELESRPGKIASEELPLSVNIDDLVTQKIGEKFSYLAKKVSSSSKMKFAEWVILQNATAFEPFRETLRGISLVAATQS